MRGEQAKAAGYTLIDPVSVLMTHLSEMFRQQSANLLTRAETERIIARVKTQDPGLVEELIPGVMNLTDIQKVLQSLLREKVSVRNVGLILEVLVDAGKQTKAPEMLTELVREKLGPIICQGLTNEEGELYVLVLDPGVERALASGIRGDADKLRLMVAPEYAEQVLSGMVGQVEKMMTANVLPVLLCAPELRRHLRGFTERVVPHLAVLSMLEVPSTINVRSFGMVSV